MISTLKTAAKPLMTQSNQTLMIFKTKKCSALKFNKIWPSKALILVNKTKAL